MTQASFPFDGTTLGDAGAYSGANFATFIRKLAGAGRGNGGDSGVIWGTEGSLRVTANDPADTSVNVGVGAALVDGRYYYNDATETVTPDSNASGSTRYDAVVLELDPTANTVRIATVKGTAGAGRPSLTQTAGGTWQIPLAYLELENGFSSIPQDKILPAARSINASAQEVVFVQNKGSALLQNGHTCTWDATNDQAVTDTTTPGENIAGVVLGEIAIDGWGFILRRGNIYVKSANACSRGDHLSTNESNRLGLYGGIRVGRALHAAASADDEILVHVDVRDHPGGQFDWHQTRYTLGSTVPDDCLLAYGQTIGNGSSGATVADDEMKALWVWIYLNVADAEAAVSGGRSGSTLSDALTDWAANKTLTVPDLRGRFPLGKDDMGGSSANVVTATAADNIGGADGSEEHTLTEAELFPHNHRLHSWNSSNGGSSQGIQVSSPKVGDVLLSDDVMHDTGGGQAHNNMPPYVTHNGYWRK